LKIKDFSKAIILSLVFLVFLFQYLPPQKKQACEGLQRSFGRYDWIIFPKILFEKKKE